MIICAYLYLEQTRLIYPGSLKGHIEPQKALLRAKAAGLVPWNDSVNGSFILEGYIRPSFTGPTSRGTIIFFHGNGEWCVDRTWDADAIARRGFRVFLYEYPGFGGRPGIPSETAIVPDARALIRSLDQAGYGPIYVWGESLGTGISAAVCADTTLPVHGLALLMPWDNLANVGLSMYPCVPVRWLLVDKYDSIANLEHFKHPVCVMRGDRDGVIPPSLTLNFFAHLSNPKKMILEKGFGHGNWPRSPELSWWDDVLNFIAPPEKALVGK